MGPAAIQAFETKFYENNPKISVTWSTESVRVAESGELAIQTGEFHDMGVGPKGEGEERGRFVTVWKKANGEWKVAHDIAASTMPEKPEPGKKR